MQLSDKHLSVLQEILQDTYSPEELDDLETLNTPALEVAAVLGQYNYEFFCRFFLIEHFSDPPADLHKELFTSIQNAINDPASQNHAYAWPRGFGKSTTLATGLILWAIIGSEGEAGRRVPLKRFILLVMDSADQAQLHLKALKRELEDNELLRAAYGDLIGPTWGAEEIETSNGVMVQALGSGKKIRGRKYGSYRPDLIIADDLENDENVQSPAQREKLKNWFYRALMHAGSPEVDLFMVGTVLHYDSLLVHVMNDARFHSRRYKALLQEPARTDLWNEWIVKYVNLSDPHRMDTAQAYYVDHAEDMEQGAIVAWPERFPLLSLQVMRIQDRHSDGNSVGSFEAEMQNEPLDASMAHFQIIRYYYETRIDHKVHFVPYDAGVPIPLDSCRLFGALDPSMGKSERADYSAIIDGLVSSTGQIFVAWADIARRGPEEQIKAIMDHYDYWKSRGLTYTSFIVETNGFQELMKNDALRTARETGRHIPFEEVKSTIRKFERISSLQPDLANGYLLLKKERGSKLPESQRMLYDQLRFWPLAGKEDGPDALEMMRTVCNNVPEVLIGYI